MGYYYSMFFEPWQHDRFLQMRAGESASYPQLGVTLHRYRDCWFCMWDCPGLDHAVGLGRELKTPQDLLAFLRGNMRVGRPITRYEDGYMGPIP